MCSFKSAPFLAWRTRWGSRTGARPPGRARYGLLVSLRARVCVAVEGLAGSDGPGLGVGLAKASRVRAVLPMRAVGRTAIATVDNVSVRTDVQKRHA